MPLVFNRFTLFNHEFWSFFLAGNQLFRLGEIYLEEGLPCSAIAANLVQAATLGAVASACIHLGLILW